MRELFRRNAASSIAHLKLHLGGCAFPPQGKCSPLGHGIKGVLGFDHGVGHPLLLLYDAKAPIGKNSNYFNGLGHDLSKLLISLFWIIIKYLIFITI
jgi:hypothetical protein